MARSIDPQGTCSWADIVLKLVRLSPPQSVAPGPGHQAIFGPLDSHQSTAGHSTSTPGHRCCHPTAHDPDGICSSRPRCCNAGSRKTCRRPTSVRCTALSALSEASEAAAAFCTACSVSVFGCGARDAQWPRKHLPGKSAERNPEKGRLRCGFSWGSRGCTHVGKAEHSQGRYCHSNPCRIRSEWGPTLRSSRKRDCCWSSAQPAVGCPGQGRLYFARTEGLKCVVDSLFGSQVHMWTMPMAVIPRRFSNLIPAVPWQALMVLAMKLSHVFGISWIEVVFITVSCVL
jgi:hypothetical protein